MIGLPGRIRATGNLELEVVHAWDEARVGDLIAVFSTYYDPEQSNQTQIGRLHNIMQGVERLNNVIVPSGEKFYFNDYWRAVYEEQRLRAWPDRQLCLQPEVGLRRRHLPGLHHTV